MEIKGLEITDSRLASDLSALGARARSAREQCADKSDEIGVERLFKEYEHAMWQLPLRTSVPSLLATCVGF